MDTSSIKNSKSPDRIKQRLMMSTGGGILLGVLFLLISGWFSILAVETEIKNYLNDQLKMSLPRTIKMLRGHREKNIKLNAWTIAGDSVIRSRILALVQSFDKNPVARKSVFLHRSK